MFFRPKGIAIFVVCLEGTLNKETWPNHITTQQI